MFDDGGRDRHAVVADLQRRLDAISGGVTNARRVGRLLPPGFAVSAQDGEAEGRRAPSGYVGRHDAVLAVPDSLSTVLPGGGVPLGSTVAVESAVAGGGGATSLLLSLLAAAREGWAAMVGIPDLGVLAAIELGIDVGRLVLVPDPGPDLVSVLSILADGMDVIAVAWPGGIDEQRGGRDVSRRAPPHASPARRRVLAGKLRRHGAVLLVLGRWPGADLVLTVQDVRWTGLGRGFGRLHDRDMDVQVTGRRAGRATGAVVTMRLRSGRGTVIAEDARGGDTVGGQGTTAVSEVVSGLRPASMTKSAS